MNNPKNQSLKDLNGREVAIMVPLLVLIFVMGLYPKPFLDKMAPSIDNLIMQVKTKQAAANRPVALNQPMQVVIPVAPVAAPQAVTPAEVK